MYSFRRVRELNENNTKKFIEERKRQAMVQSRQIETLHKVHQEQTDNLTRDVEKVIIINGFYFVKPYSN